MPFAVSVVDLGEDAAQFPGSVVAPEQAQRIERVPEHPSAGEQVIRAPSFRSGPPGLLALQT